MSERETDRARERKLPDRSDPKADRPRPQNAPLDLESLDLRVDDVEERISPRETNVFDK